MQYSVYVLQYSVHVLQYRVYVLQYSVHVLKYSVYVLQYSVYVSGDEKEDEVVILYSRFCQGSAEWARYSTILKCTVKPITLWNRNMAF